MPIESCGSLELPENMMGWGEAGGREEEQALEGLWPAFPLNVRSASR